MKNSNIFEQFTNLYSLSKTLRFELKPVGSDGKYLSQEEANKVFKNIIEQDKKIKEAYVALKPIMDKIHEEVITRGLESDSAKKIDEAVKAILDEALKDCTKILTDNRDKLDMLTQALVDNETLSDAEIRDLLGFEQIVDLEENEQESSIGLEGPHIHLKDDV